MAQAQTSLWGSKGIVFIAGIAVLLWLGNTVLSPIVVAFLAAAVTYWALANS